MNCHAFLQGIFPTQRSNPWPLRPWQALAGGFFTTSTTWETFFPSESESHSVMSNCFEIPWDCSPWDSPGQNTGVDSLSLLQVIFPTQGLNPGLLHCRQVLYQLSPIASCSSMCCVLSHSVSLISNYTFILSFIMFALGLFCYSKFLS